MTGQQRHKNRQTENKKTKRQKERQKENQVEKQKKRQYKKRNIGCFLKRFTINVKKKCKKQ